jgi:hypothetical protein
LTTGIVQTAWVLDRIRRGFTEEPRVFFRWSEFTGHSGGLFFWEAFVSGAAKAGSHAGDAILAVRAFASALPNPESANVVSEPRVYSLIGAALLRTGWAVPTSVLSAPCTVVRV